eukprot:7586880-Pyramimonas_sp.AAC.1
MGATGQGCIGRWWVSISWHCASEGTLQFRHMAQPRAVPIASPIYVGIGNPTLLELAKSYSVVPKHQVQGLTWPLAARPRIVAEWGRGVLEG